MNISDEIDLESGVGSTSCGESTARASDLSSSDFRTSAPAPRRNVVPDTTLSPARGYFGAEFVTDPVLPINDASFKSCEPSDRVLPESLGPSATLPVSVRHRDRSASSKPFRDRGPRSRRNDRNNAKAAVNEAEEWLPAIGEQVYYCAGRQCFSNGDVIRFGAPCYAVSVLNDTGIHESPFRNKRTHLVEVFFEGNKQHVCLRSTELSETRPQLAEGFHVGDVVVFCGKRTVKVSDTDVLRPGLRGEVVGGAARRSGNSAGTRLSVKFEGHLKNTPLPLSAVRLEEVVIDIDG